MKIVSWAVLFIGVPIIGLYLLFISSTEGGAAMHPLNYLGVVLIGVESSVAIYLALKKIGLEESLQELKRNHCTLKYRAEHLEGVIKNVCAENIKILKEVGYHDLGELNAINDNALAGKMSWPATLVTIRESEQRKLKEMHVELVDLRPKAERADHLIEVLQKLLSKIASLMISDAEMLLNSRGFSAQEEKALIDANEEGDSITLLSNKFAKRYRHALVKRLLDLLCLGFKTHEYLDPDSQAPLRPVDLMRSDPDVFVDVIDDMVMRGQEILPGHPDAELELIRWSKRGRVMVPEPKPSSAKDAEGEPKPATAI